MFRKIIVFGLFEMIQKKKKKKVRTASPSRVGYDSSGRHSGWLVMSILYTHFIPMFYL